MQYTANFPLLKITNITADYIYSLFQMSFAGTYTQLNVSKLPIIMQKKVSIMRKEGLNVLILFAS